MPVLAHIPEDRFLEATRDNRNSGEPSTSGFVAVHYPGNTIDQPINTQFVCVRGVDLTSEFDEQDPRDNLAVLSRSDRHCTKWWPWTQGLPPSWHLQDMHMQELEARREKSARDVLFWTHFWAFMQVAAAVVGIVVTVAITQCSRPATTEAPPIISPIATPPTTP